MECVPLGAMLSIKMNGFHYREWLPLKGMASTKRDGFNYKEWLPLKMNGFH